MRDSRGNGGILTFLLIFILALATFNVSYTRNEVKHEVEYNGFVWILLDRYSIWKYNSQEVPKKWVKYKKTPAPKYSRVLNYPSTNRFLVKKRNRTKRISYIS